MQIDKFISPFIENQFPQFYKEEGPIFIEFVKSYYEWLESTGNVIDVSRNLLESRDIDTTLENYITYFKNKYINSLPENILSDKKLLIKHILDLYRSKGAESSYKLLFKMIFNEDIETYIPGDHIFKLSESEWVRPIYIEVSDNPYLSRMIGNKIYSSSTLSTATVENYYVKTANDKVINVLVLSNMNGDFRYGEKIFCEAIPEISVASAPVVFGSLTSVSVVNGGLGYNIGDILNVKYSGKGGLARVRATTEKNGEVTFELLKGGTGFSVDAAINVDGKAIAIQNTTPTNPVVVYTAEKHGLKDATSIRIGYVVGMDDLNTDTYQYFIKVIPDSELPVKYIGKAFSLYKDISLTQTVNGTTFNPYYSDGYIYVNTGAQQQANFKIGSIVNKEIYNINLDHVRDTALEEMDITAEGYNIHISGITGTFSAGDMLKMSDVRVLDADCVLLSDGAYLANGEILSNTELGINDLRIVNVDTGIDTDLNVGINLNNNYIQVTGSSIDTVYNIVKNGLPSIVPVKLISNVSKTKLSIFSVYGINTVNCYANVVIATSTSLAANVKIRSSYEHIIYPHTGTPDDDTIIRNGIDSANQVIRLINANTYFSVGDRVIYASPNTFGVPAPNTPISASYTSDRFQITSMVNNSGTVTVSFAAQKFPPYVVGQPITISGVTPSGYNGMYNVTSCTYNSVTFQTSTTGSITVLGYVEASNKFKINTMTNTDGVVTINFAQQNRAPYVANQAILVSGVTSSSYNGIHYVTFCTNSSVTFETSVEDLITVTGYVQAYTPLLSNTVYYCASVNSSSIGLSFTKNGSKIPIIETRPPPNIGGYVETHTLSAIEGFFINGETIKSIGTAIDSTYISISSPAVITVPAYSAPVNGTPVTFKSYNGSLPNGITAGTTYYTKYVNEHQFQISLTVNGTSIYTTGPAPSPIGTNPDILFPEDIGLDPYTDILTRHLYPSYIIYTVYYDKASATIGKVDRLTDWDPAFGPSGGRRKNLDIDLSILQYRQKEVGTIASLTDINPGKGYSVDPVVSIMEPLIYDLEIYEPFGPYKGTRKGFNASVSAKAGSANGIVTAVEIVDSGYGYGRNSVVELLSNSNPYAVTGTTVVDRTGIGKGYWKSNKSFLSDEMYLQDSYYYQKYSYEIVAPRMLDTYENYVKKLVHPAGILLFGKYIVSNEMMTEEVESVSFELSSYFTVTVDNTNYTVDNNTDGISVDHN
jgi:hypothetical protein